MGKRFDAVAWMRQQRAAIDEEDKGLTWEEKRRKTAARLEGDPLWERLKDRVASSASKLARSRSRQ